MNKIKETHKASDLYTRLYGRAAYLAWKKREAEIDLLMKDGKRYTVGDIVGMREENYRKMKACERPILATARHLPKAEKSAA